MNDNTKPRNNQIKSAERKYWIQLPNLIDDMELSVYAFRLYLHLKRRAGDSGECFESSRNMAKHCNMSEGSISNAKRELVKAGLIYIKTRSKPGGEYHVITIRDVWHKNMATYGKQPEEECSPDEHFCSPDETKKNPLRKEKTNSKKQEFVTTTVQSRKNSSTGKSERRLTLQEKVAALIKEQKRAPIMGAIDEAIVMWVRECDVANRDVPEEQRWKPTNMDAILERYDIVTAMVRTV